MEHGFNWAEEIGFLSDFLAKIGIDPRAGINALIVSGLLLLLAFFGGRKFRRSEMVEPEGRVTLTFFVEFTLAKMLAFFESIITHDARKLFFLLGTFAFFILGNNLIGAIPGFNPPTDQLNVTVTLALMTFFTAHFLGIRTHGFAYIKKFLGPIWWLVPLMLPIELISHLVRPLSLSVRLFGNMTADHLVVAAITTFVFAQLLDFPAILAPIPFMGLGIMVAVVQTFVFVLLSSVYFQDAMEHPH